MLGVANGNNDQYSIHFKKGINKGKDPIIPEIPEFTWNDFVDVNVKESRKLEIDDAVKVDERLIRGLDELQKIISKVRGKRPNGKEYKIRIHKAYLTEETYSKIKNKNKSTKYYCAGEAALISCNGISVNELASYATEVEVFRQGGIGRYLKEHCIHVDVENFDPGRRWIE